MIRGLECSEIEKLAVFLHESGALIPSQQFYLTYC